MKLERWLLALAILTVAAAAYGKEVNLAAAVSLKECLDEIILRYHRLHPDVRIVANYESSGKLQTQIEHGAPADLFISAGGEKMDLLERKGLLLAGTRCDLLENKVVLIVPAASTLELDSFAALASDRLKAKSIAIGDPDAVPAGQYAVEIFTKLKIRDRVMPKTVFASNVRAVLTFVIRHEVEAGIVYQTDAELAGSQVKVVAAAPPGSHTPAVYPAAVIAAGTAKAEGAEFLAYLKTPEAAAVFRKYGFLPKRRDAAETD